MFSGPAAEASLRRRGRAVCAPRVLSLPPFSGSPGSRIPPAFFHLRVPSFSGSSHFPRFFTPVFLRFPHSLVPLVPSSPGLFRAPIFSTPVSPPPAFPIAAPFSPGRLSPFPENAAPRAPMGKSRLPSGMKGGSGWCADPGGQRPRARRIRACAPTARALSSMANSLAWRGWPVPRPRWNMRMGRRSP